MFREETLIHSWRLTTIRERTSESSVLITRTASQRCPQADISGIVVESVVPPLTATLVSMVTDYFGRVPLLFERRSTAACRFLYDNPREVGAMRVVTAIAAFEAYGKGCDSVVDFGTATTLMRLPPRANISAA